MIEITNARVREITLEAGENKIKFDRAYLGFEVKNTSGADVVMSLLPGKVAGDNGVVTIPNGESYNYLHLEHRDTFYLTGSGSVTVAGTSAPGSNFNSSQKGGDGTRITPESLGYASGSELFFDGVYNFCQGHADNGAYWLDMSSGAIMRRYLVDTGKALLASDHYIKESGADSALRIPILFDDDNFTLELFFEITGGNTSENDIINNFDRAGFGVFTENSKLNLGIFNGTTGAYVYTAGVSYDNDTKYHVAVTYDGEAVKLYLNGELNESLSLALSDYKKSTKSPYIGCVGGGGTYYSQGAYNLYRVAYYNSALSQQQLNAHYTRDKERFGA